MIWSYLGPLILFSLAFGATFWKIPSWFPGSLISLPITYFIIETNNYLRTNLVDSPNISDGLSMFLTLVGATVIWGLTSFGVLIGKRFRVFIVSFKTNKRNVWNFPNKWFSEISPQLLPPFGWGRKKWLESAMGLKVQDCWRTSFNRSTWANLW